MTSSSIPDSISTEALEALQMLATPEVSDTSLKDAEPQIQIDRIIEKVEELSDEWGTIFAYKLIADYCVHQMFQHHKEVATAYFKDGEETTSAAWSRDAGQLQVLSATLRNITCGPTDFLSPENAE